jgi:hypothetical protein
MFICPCFSLCFYKIIVDKEDLMEFSVRISISTLAKTSLIWFPLITIIMDRNILKALSCQMSKPATNSNQTKKN